MKPEVIRAKLREILEGSEPLNTSQICRLFHGAANKYHIHFCQPKKWDTRQDRDGFARRGNNALYPNCHGCNPGYGAIYRNLMVLVDQGYAETRVEVRQDPIVPTQKDRMRMWALRGMLPSLLPFLEVENRE